MRALAEDSQGPSLNYLQQEANRGRVSDIESLYLRNAIAAEATPAVIRELAGTTIVDRVIVDTRLSVLDNTSANSQLGPLYSELNQTDGEVISPAGFERVVDGDPVRGVEEIQADVVQSAGINGSGVNVSVVDTGINDSHPALEGQVVKRRNFVNNETNVGDPEGHGTHVAATVAGQPTAQDAVGVAPGANLFDARALDSSGAGRISDIISAFEWSADENADVVSASLGLSPLSVAQEERIQIGNESTQTKTFEVDQNATDGFSPAYTFVVVDTPETLNGSADVDANTTLDNLTVSVVNPNGTASLERNSAGFLYASGLVPEGLLAYKFTPETAQRLTAGNWSVEVTNNNANTGIEVNITAAPVYVPDGTSDVSQAVNNLESTGTIPVVSAGNDGFLGNQSIGAPAAAENAITVGASTPNSIDVAAFSSRGPVGFGADARPGVDVIAPGVDIRSAASPQVQPGDEPYTSKTGTSMAAPHVSGTIALLLDAEPSQNRSSVENALEATAQAPPEGTNAVGAGAIDAYAAVNSVTPGTLAENNTAGGGIEVFAGLGNTSDRNVYVDPQPGTDPTGDAGDAPDIAEAAVEVSYDAEFRIGLADSGPANASFVTYIDADKNSSTGDPRQFGAEYRLNLTRTYTDGSYGGTIDAYRFNQSSLLYEPTDLTEQVNDYAFDDRPEYIEYEVDTDDFDGINTTSFNWHVVTKDVESSDSDRFPDSEQADTNYTANIDGIGVAWDTTAGEPAIDEPLTFRLFGDNGALLANRTVRTDASGIAQTRFADLSRTNTDYTLEVETAQGSVIQQQYDLGDPNVDRGPQGGSPTNSDEAYTVIERGYETRPDSPVELNVPIYTTANGTITPYTGPASIRFEGEGGTVINNLTVDDGVLTETVAPATLPEFGEETTIVDFGVALTANFSDAQTVYRGGDIDQETDVTVTSSVVPETQVTPPQTEAQVSFQTIAERPDADEQYQSRSPANVSSSYEVTWVTDRNVASFYNELPDSVAAALAAARQTDGTPEPLAPGQQEAVQKAIDNISTQDTVPRIASGTVAPQRRGIGQFGVTPPEDARIGFVTLTPNASAIENETVQLVSDDAVVFVDQRVDAYQRTPTAPQTADQYYLDLDTFWDETEVRDGVYVPNESIEVRAELRNQVTGEPITQTEITLYTTGGDTKTVTTDGDGRVRTTIPAPDLDYLNNSYEFEQQEVLGIVNGLQSANGEAVSETDVAFGSAFTVGGGEDSTEQDASVFAEPELSYNESEDTLGLDVTYRNTTTFEKVNATRSVVMVGTPNAVFNTQRDVFAGYLGGSTNATSVSREFTEEVPSDRRQNFEVETRTPGDYTGFDGVYLGGIRAGIDAPRDISPGETANVTVELNNRTDGPVTDASVVLYYTELDSDGTVTSAGGSIIGTTNASGEARFALTPELADEFNQGRIRLRVGYATDRVASERAGFAQIQIEEATELTGSVQGPNGKILDDDFVLVDDSPEDIGLSNVEETDANGNFEIAVEPGNAFDLALFQNETPTDGVPDFHTFASTGVIANSTDLGTNTLPTGHTTTVTVEDEAGNTVKNATVVITSHGTRSHSAGGVSLSPLTSADGTLPIEGGLELADNVTITARPPENSSGFVTGLDQYSQELTVTEDESVTITLQRDEDDTGDTTAPTVKVTAPETATVGESFTVDASASTDNTGIANYTFVLPDGTEQTQESPTREVTISETGSKEITVRVTDVAGNQNSSTVTVDIVEGADLATALSVADGQRLQDGVTANVTVSNEGSTGYANNFDVAVTLSNGTTSTAQTYEVTGLGAGETNTKTVDFTTFAQQAQLTGDVTIDAVAAPNGTTSEITDTNNNASAQTTITYSDIAVQLFAPQQAVEGEQTGVFVLFRNEGTAPSAQLTATVSGAGVPDGETTVPVPALNPGSVNTTELQVTGANTTFTAAVEGDTLFPGNNESSESLSVQPYSLGVEQTDSPTTVEAGSTFYVTSRVSASVAGTVNATLDTPADVSVVDTASKDVFIRGTERVTWEVKTDRSVPADTTTTFDVTVSAFNESATGTTDTTVETPKLRVSDSNSTSVENKTTETLTVGIRNETTYDHDLSINLQAGSDGRTLKGLDYLINYPYGCVEQTTSPMLTALNTDQYYRDTTVNYDEASVDNAVAGGVERLSTGQVGQQDNGAWTMWGNDGTGDVFYTLYALYGTSEVANDPVQGSRTEVADNLTAINQTAAAKWLNGEQAADGSFETSYYYDDRQSTTGLALVSLDQAKQAGADAEAVAAVQEDAVAFLLAEQNADGSWNANGETTSPMATALAVRGLTTVTNDDTVEVNATAVETAIADGTSYLKEAQQADGSWAPYHDSSSFNRQGATSETTAHAVLALTDANVSSDTETIQLANTYLQTVYEEDGSWGYTRATAIAIEALQAVDGGADTSQTVTVTISAGETVAYNDTVELNASSSLETIELSGADNQTLTELRANADGQLQIEIETSGSGLVIVSAENTQLVNENEYIDNGGA
jgi:subtilisin family serine protease